MQTLFDQPKVLSDFEQYDAEHPEIWRQFRGITFGLIRRGKKHYGAKAISEIIRYHRIIEYGETEFKVNNNFTAYYSRKFMKLFPQHNGFFETRKAKNGSYSGAVNNP